MRIATIIGTRPEIIKLSRVIARLDDLTDHVLIHTGQNYDNNLNDIFFEELGVRSPDVVIDSRADSLMAQIGKILVGVEKALIENKIDRVLILGDTNSGLSAIVAKRLGIPVFHMEAGNRCYDDRVPEELNRRVIDTSSDILLPYTHRSKEILFGEGYRKNKVIVIGNPINEVLNHHKEKIESSTVLKSLGLSKGKYFLLTLHRSENVDNPERLQRYLDSIDEISKKYNLPIVFSLHPRTKDQLKKQGKNLDKDGLIVIEPLGFFDFVSLELNAFCTISDSGTPQEECAIYGVPSVLLRDVTERHETLDAGSNFIAGSSAQSIIRGIDVVTSGDVEWETPQDYTKLNVSDTVTRVILSHWDFS